MGIFDKLFGRHDKPRTPPRDLTPILSPLAVPAVQAVLTSTPTSSYFLGDPGLPAGIGWPEKDARKLDFLACIDLAKLAAAHRISWLPERGSLKFFYAMDPGPWGFDPKDRGGWAVLHDPEPPPVTAKPFTSRNVEFRKIQSYPDFERAKPLVDQLSDDELDGFTELQDLEFSKLPVHQVGGYPMPIQGDGMELECQLVSNGIYCGDAKGYKSARAKELEAGSSDWRLLFQIDSDEKLEFMWGDGGRLYFWIREQDARAGNFDRAWVILQCS